MTRYTSLAALQAAIYSKLTGDATLLALAPVYDEVPEGIRPPYIVIGDATEVPYDSFSSRGFEATITLHIWTAPRPTGTSRAVGYKPALDILDRVNYLLNEATLTLSDLTFVYCRLENVQTLRDGLARHVTARYRILSQQ